MNIGWKQIGFEIVINDFAGNAIVCSVPIMTSQHFLQKSYSGKNGWYYIVSYIWYMTVIELYYFLWVKNTT